MPSCKGEIQMRYSVLLVTLLVSVVFLSPVTPVGAQDPCVRGMLPSGALTEVCVPPAWNGDLVLFAHGYVPPQLPLALPVLRLSDGTDLKDEVLSLGFALATTSYSKNGYAIQQGGDDVQALRDLIADQFAGRLRHIYLVGVSEGTLITVMLLERHPESYDGALALCGPLDGGPSILKYLGDFRVVFDYFFPTVFPFGALDVPPDAYLDWLTVYMPAIAGAVESDPLATDQLLDVTGAAVDPQDPGTSVSTAVGMLVYSIFGSNDLLATASGNPYDNASTDYQGSLDDVALNAGVERVDADPAARAYVQQFYETTGDIGVPLVTLHTLFDPIVPYAQEVAYAEKVAGSGDEALLTVIPVERYGHCNFTEAEVLDAFAQLVQQVEPRTGLELYHLPALDTVNCQTWLQVQNVGDDYTKAILVTWGDPGACEPQAAGPIKAECSGLIRPGSAWTWRGAQLPSGARSGVVYSLGVGATDTGDIAADVVCEFFAETVLGDDDDWRRFDRVFRDGGTLSWTGGEVAFPDGLGEPLAVTVNRECPGDNTPGVDVNAAYTGISQPMQGIYDPVSGGYMYYAPLVWASYGIAPNDWNSVIHIQNSGDECTSVELWFQAQEQCLRATIGQVLALAPGEAWQFDPHTVVGPFFQGSVWIRASQPLAVVVDQMGPDLFMSYRGFPADNATAGALPPGGDLFTVGSLVNYAPLTYREYNGWDAGVQVQNLSPVVNAKVKVTFSDASGDIVTTIVDWICPRGSQTFFLPAIAWPNWAYEYVGAAQIESQDWWSPGDPGVDAPHVMSVVNLVKYQDATRSAALEALAYNAFSELEAFNWQLGRWYPGVSDIAIPFVAQDKQGVTSEIAVQNVNPSPGFTDFTIEVYDQNGVLDHICEKLNERQVEYVDLSQWSVIQPGFLGSIVIRPAFWSQQPGPALAAVGVERVGRVLSDPDVPGDESKGFEGVVAPRALSSGAGTNRCQP